LAAAVRVAVKLLAAVALVAIVLPLQENLLVEAVLLSLLLRLPQEPLIRLR
jgi:hypothetical protein